MIRVLVVEDQRMPCEIIERILLDSKRYTLVAGIIDTSLALASCRRHSVDLVLMDVCTAGSKDGISAAAEIKAWKPQIKVIIITSMVEVGFLKRAKGKTWADVHGTGSVYINQQLYYDSDENGAAM